MKWEKLGRIFRVDNNSDLMRTHCQAPTPLRFEDKIRIYFSTRDKDGHTRPSYIEVLAEDPTKITAMAESPLIDLGKPGAFDDCGVMPTYVMRRHDGTYLMYYVGWSRCVKVPYQQYAGLLVSDDGKNFHRIQDGPLLGRSICEPFGAASPCVAPGAVEHHMAYISYGEWVDHNGLMEPSYCIKVCMSRDLFSWQPTQDVAIGKEVGDCLARPWFVTPNKLIFSRREVTNFRTARDRSYRVWEASFDGKKWHSQQMPIEPSAEGWDSEMLAYGVVLKNEFGTFLFYNGNGFGREGMGVAVLR